MCHQSLSLALKRDFVFRTDIRAPYVTTCLFCLVYEKNVRTNFKYKTVTPQTKSLYKISAKVDKLEVNEMHLYLLEFLMNFEALQFYLISSHIDNLLVLHGSIVLNRFWHDDFVIHPDSLGQSLNDDTEGGSGSKSDNPLGICFQIGMITGDLKGNWLAESLYTIWKFVFQYWFLIQNLQKMVRQQAKEKN